MTELTDPMERPISLLSNTMYGASLAWCVKSGPRFWHTSHRNFARKPKSASSVQWLARQEKDPYVKSARAENYRARSAYKLLEIDDRFKLMKPGHTVIDCGAAPGSWTQVAVDRVNALHTNTSKLQGKAVAIDLLFIPPIDGAKILDHSDFCEMEVQQRVLSHVGETVDIVLSDMAPNATGMHDMDHEKIVSLFESAWKFARHILAENGHFVGKLWDGYHLNRLRKELHPLFRSLKVVKPDASRKESSELFVMGKGFKRYLVQPHEKQTGQ
ncbi:rRNA methyltransferase 2, mitochondrial [Holothuria leucospilota]|uniref:rRNA methyltransferase 2, mitochondrial n=1 Tax=Holothuria leucospilota TaxID=206669 RepID=A0A9Q1C3X8_HOLLE|nr:rRNA methyltransferase 2, mitochondrial [Holothuria leucospilota]